ncbi:hypothetical protein HC131_04485 [Streptococcus anginosus]|uniref:hypothetical protein n=1 Tax=Streptococcus anginosus TaxID=1328 RepID=UPI00142F9D19|nr:hypothetical protein [Streptococcus anginosus]NJJ27007.1 hypothetical protein [Streptococcus anginosus]
MNNLFNFVGHVITMTALLTAWLFPLFHVTIIRKFEKEKRIYRASLVLMMLLKIIYPYSQIQLRQWGKEK